MTASGVVRAYCMWRDKSRLRKSRALWRALRLAGMMYLSFKLDALERQQNGQAFTDLEGVAQGIACCAAGHHHRRDVDHRGPAARPFRALVQCFVHPQARTAFAAQAGIRSVGPFPAARRTKTGSDRNDTSHGIASSVCAASQN